MKIKVLFQKAMHVLLLIGIISSLLTIPNQRVFAKPLSTFTDCASQADIPETECNALVAVYNSTNGPSWNNSSNWLTDTPCTWFGVTCSGGNVTSLILGIQNGSGWNGNGLSGTIPPEIGDLTHLVTLILANNQLGGPIPTELQNLTDLTTLDLGHNSLTGSIPVELGNLTNLTTLDLSLNLLNGSIPMQLGNLTSLTKLFLYRNQLTGSIPTQLGNLTNLSRLLLHNNLLIGSIPTTLANLTQLQQLWLDDNQLSGSIPTGFGSLTNLTELILYNNQLTGSIPTQLGNLTNLTKLDFGGNQLSGSIPSEIGNLTNLTHLHLGHNYLTGPFPGSLTNLTHLTLLVVSENNLSGSLPANLGNLTQLKSLWLGQTNLAGEIPTSFVNLSRLTNFTVNCYLTSTDAKVISIINSLLSPGWDLNCLTNDDVDRNIHIFSSSLPYTNTQSHFATTDPNDPTFECGNLTQGKGSVWYTYSSFSPGTLTINTFGSNYDTMLAVWTKPFGHLVNLACNDDSIGNGYQSQVTINIVPGKFYYIEVAGYSGGGTLVLNASKPSIPPVSITHTITSNALQDGSILESSETSSKGGTLNSKTSTFSLGDDASKKQYRGILSFNTGNDLPDTAVITSVILKIKKQSIIGEGNPLISFKGLMVDLKTGFFDSIGLQINDFQAIASKVYGPFMPTSVNSWYSINLTTGKAYINKLATNSNLTQIRLRFKLDDNNNAIANKLVFFSGNAPAASRPQLVITYYVP